MILKTLFNNLHTGIIAFLLQIIIKLKIPHCPPDQLLTLWITSSSANSHLVEKHTRALLGRVPSHTPMQGAENMIAPLSSLK